MNDIQKMELVQERINEILKEFKASKVFPKSKIMKYYQGLEVTYDEFIEKLEESLGSELDEEQAEKFADLLEDF